MTNFVRWSVGAWLLLSTAVTFAAEIPWAESFLAARNQAEYERRLILIHFYSDDCPPCEVVERDVFTDKDVQSAIEQNYVALKIHAKQMPALAQKYSVHRWPTDVIVSHAGQEIYRTISPRNPVKYAAMLNSTAMQGGVGAGRTPGDRASAAEINNTTASTEPSAPATSAAAPKVPMGAAAAAWNDNAPPPQNYNNTPGMVMNPWVTQAAQATEAAGRTAQQWGGYAQQQAQAAQQYMQPPPAGQAAGQLPSAAQQYQAAAQETAQKYQAAAQQTLGQYQQAAQQTYGQSRDAAQQVANQYQAQAQQTANQFQATAQQTVNQAQTAAQQTADKWQAEANQVQQKASQYEQAAGQAVDNYAAAAQQKFNGYNQAAQDQAHNAAATAGQTIETYRRSANAAVDNIANATTMPSQLPPRQGTFGGGGLVTNTPPQPGRVSEGTNEVPRTTTIRSGEMTASAPSNTPWQPNAPPLTSAAPNMEQPTTGPYSAAPPPVTSASRRNTFAGYVPPPAENAPSPAASAPGNTPWNVPTMNKPAEDSTAGGSAPSWQGSATVAETPRQTWNANANPDVRPPASTPAAPPENRTTYGGPSANPNYGESAPPSQSPPSNSPPPQQRPVSAPAAFALEGFCPVSMLETKKWIKGDSRFGAVHCGQTYLFVSEDAQKKFLASPDRYAPVLACHDPVRFADTAQLVTGNRKHGIIYKQQIYLFADEASLMQFSKAPDRYAGAAYQAMMERDRNIRR